MSEKKKKQSGLRDVPLSVRVPADVRDGVDRMASAAEMSRSKFVGRLLRDVVRMDRAAEDSGLFDEWEDDFQRVIEAAIRDAVRSGGIDQVLGERLKGKKGGRK